MTDDYITRTRQFFGAKAATWDANFGHCHVRLRRHRGAGIRHGGTAVNLSCGNGRALSVLRDACPGTRISAR